MHASVPLFFYGGRWGRWKEGKCAFSHCPLVDLTVLVSAVGTRDITEPKFDYWRTKLAQTKVQGPTYPSPKVQGQF